MKTYQVILSYGWQILGEFAVYANNLQDAKKKAQTEKRIFIRYDKPEGIPPHRIRVKTSYIATNQDYSY